MQHRDRQDEGEVEPVRHKDVRLLAPVERAQEDQQIDDPDDGQPEVGVPLGLSVFLAVRDAEQVACAGDQDEEVVAEHHEPGRQVARQARPAGALDHIERRRQQHVAAESEDHGGGVQRPQAPEVEPWRNIEVGERQFEGDIDADGHAGQTPEKGHQCRELDRTEIVVRQPVDFERWRLGRPRVVTLEDREDGNGSGERSKPHVECEGRFDRPGCNKNAKQAKEREDRNKPPLAAPKRLRLRDRVHFTSPEPRRISLRSVPCAASDEPESPVTGYRRTAIAAAGSCVVFV